MAPRWRSGSRALAALADAFVVPSAFALERLHELRAPVGQAHVLPHVIRQFAAAALRRPADVMRWWWPAWRPRRASMSRSRPAGSPACRWSWPATGPSANVWPRRPVPDVTFAGRVDDRELDALARETP